MAKASAFAKRAFGRAADYVRGDRVFFVGIVLLGMLPSIAIDQTLTGSAGNFADAIVGLIVLYLQLLVTFRALHSAGAAPAGYDKRHLTEGRFGSAWGAGVLETLAVVAGLILLVIPGIVLMLLWSMAIPAIAAERLGASDALRRSWQLARPALGRLGVIGSCFVLIVTVAAMLALIIIVIWPDIGVLASGVTNALFYPILLFSPAVWTFAYLDLRTNAVAADILD